MIFGIDVLHLLLGWFLAALVLTVVLWRLTRSLAVWSRVLLRCLVLVAGFGFMGAGTDAAAIPIPLLLLAIRFPADWPQLLLAFLVFWLVFVAAYLGIRAVCLRVGKGRELDRVA